MNIASTGEKIALGVFALATIAVVFARPQAISDFFNGLGNVTKAAVSPVG